MKTTCLLKTTLRLPTGWLRTVPLLVLALLLPARADDPVLNPNFPKDATASLGGTVSFQVSASTTNPPLSYQWQHQGTNLEGATLRTLGLTNVTELDAGGYQAIIWNASGDSATSRVAQLTVDPTFIKITQGPGADLQKAIGASWADYDVDGYLDLFIANGGTTGSTNSLYRNNRDGTFTRITTNAITLKQAGGHCGVWTDFDNDGDPDLHVVQGDTYPDFFYRNDRNGVFTELQPAFITDRLSNLSATWWDYDQDGQLDVLSGHQFGTDRLYRGLSDGSFRSMTANEVGDAVTGRMCYRAAPADYDNDGWQDALLIPFSPSSALPYRLLHNEGNGVFRHITEGPLANQPGFTGVTVEAAWGDYDNDGDFDVMVLGGGSGGTNRLFRNLGAGVFEVEGVAQAAGVDRPLHAWYSIWGDYDNDGFLDLFMSQPGATNTLFRNNSDGTFTSIDVGSPIRDGVRDVEPSWADYDNDGFLDLFISAGNAQPEVNYLYRNNLKATGNTNHWLKVKLQGQASNRDGVGAKVRVKATIRGQTVWQLRQIEAPGTPDTQNQGFLAHFGLGDATVAETVRIEWPSGNVQELTNVTPDQLLRLTEQTFITPARPLVSLNGSVTLTRTAVSGATYQWQFDGTDLIGQTNRTLNLTNIVADQEGRYSVVVSNTSTLVTNYVYLHVDTTFTKITEGPVVTDRANFLLGTWADYDDDGFNDLLVPAGTDVAGQAPAFYHNLGGTNFVKLTTNDVGEVVGRRPYCVQGLWADYNNDGYLDLLEIGAVLRAGAWTSSNRFFLGRPDRTFDWVTADVGVNPPVDSWQCSLVDYDNDGAVDVYYTSGWVDRQSRDRLYRNRGDGTFVHAWSPTGPIGDTQYGCWSDYDNDGDRDLWLGVYGSPAQFYRNNGDGTFSGNLAGTEIPRTTSFYGTWGDYDNDGYQDFLTMTALYHNTRNGSFTNVANFPEGAGHWGDYDNDGDLDFVKGYWNQQPCVFYRNDGGGVFTRVDLGSPSRDVPANESLQTWGDYNNDGFLDLFVGTRGNPTGANLLYRNSGLAGGNTNHWLIVKPRGTTSNRSAIGAKVRVQATIRGTVTWQLREIQGNYFDDLRAHFGLGNAANVTTVRIEWPSGTVQELTNVASDQILEVVEPRRPVLALLALSPSKVDGSLRADPALAYVIEASDDLASWTVLVTVTTDASGVAAWSDTSSPLAAHRYYKASRNSP